MQEYHNIQQSIWFRKKSNTWTFEKVTKGILNSFNIVSRSGLNRFVLAHQNSQQLDFALWHILQTASERVIALTPNEKEDGTKGVIRILISKKKNEIQLLKETQQKDKQWFTKHYIGYR